MATTLSTYSSAINLDRSLALEQVDALMEKEQIIASEDPLVTENLVSPFLPDEY
jgi:hypothetical protein